VTGVPDNVVIRYGPERGDGDYYHVSPNDVEKVQAPATTDLDLPEGVVAFDLGEHLRNPKKVCFLCEKDLAKEVGVPCCQRCADTYPDDELIRRYTQHQRLKERS
jgi:hypothetical protein